MNQLHMLNFPDTYLTVAEMIEKSQSQNHQLIVKRHKDQLVGYCFITGDDGDSEGYIDYICVDATFHKKGIGKELLEGALNWIFIDKNYQQAALTVRQSNLAAISLYQKVGFNLKYEGVGYDKNLN